VWQSADPALTPGETQLARSVFGDSIDYSKTEIFADAGRAYVNPFTRNIHMGPEAAVDVSKEGVQARATFIHEMTHVRQAQTVVGRFSLAIQAGMGHAWASVKGFFIGLFTSKTIGQAIYEQDIKLYQFEGTPSQSLGSYGKEQQAEIVQKSYERTQVPSVKKTSSEMDKAKDIMDKSPNFPKSLE
jgi:hypothetical protein